MANAPSKPVVHLELHTGDLARASALYAELCGWQPERIDAGCRPYTALELGNGLGGGIVECPTARPLWLPYVEVPQIDTATERARELGAEVLLEPREGAAGGRGGAGGGPAGGRGGGAGPASGELAFWQSKRR